MRFSRNLNAFTLIEVMAATVMVVAVLGAVFAMYSATTRSMEASRERIDLAQESANLLQRMARDIRCAVLPDAPSVEQIAETGETIIREDEQAAFAGGSERSEILRFLTTSATLPPDSSHAGVYEVAWRFDSASATLLRSQAHELEVSDEDTWVPVAVGVTRIDLEFFDGERWIASWDSGEQGSLPAAVRLAVVFDTEATFETTVAVAGGIRKEPQ